MKIHNLNQLQKDVDNLIQQFGGYWPPLSLLAAVSEEVGEIAREINAMEGFKPKRNQKELMNLDNTSKIGEELADLMFSLICMANYYQTDLAKDFEQTLQKYLKRDKDRYTNLKKI